mmetsp:Transcript_16561/g.39406  ORF Transcript_16561/g.39406 Transcript_16561/m.39406 type:complete len:277 (+) Transcript_16561:515-1345(+)
MSLFFCSKRPVTSWRNWVCWCRRDSTRPSRCWMRSLSNATSSLGVPRSSEFARDSDMRSCAFCSSSIASRCSDPLLLPSCPAEDVDAMAGASLPSPSCCCSLRNSLMRSSISICTMRSSFSRRMNSSETFSACTSSSSCRHRAFSVSPASTSCVSSEIFSLDDSILVGSSEPLPSTTPSAEDAWGWNICPAPPARFHAAAGVGRCAVEPFMGAIWSESSMGGGVPSSPRPHGPSASMICEFFSGEDVACSMVTRWRWISAAVFWSRMSSIIRWCRS